MATAKRSTAQPRGELRGPRPQAHRLRLGLRRLTPMPGGQPVLEWITGRPANVGPGCGMFRDISAASRPPWRLHQVKGVLHSNGRRYTVRVVTGISRMIRGEKQWWLTRAQSRIRLPAGSHPEVKGRILCVAGDLCIGLEEAWFVADTRPNRRNTYAHITPLVLPPWEPTSEPLMLRQQIRVFGLRGAD